MPASTASTEGEAKTSPQTAAVSMPRPTKPACAGSWPGAAAGDQRDLRAVPVGAHHDADVRVAVEPREPAAGGRDEAVDRLGDDVFPAVDELGHDALSQVRRAPAASK